MARRSQTYRPPLPERIGGLGQAQGLMITCRGCGHGAALPRAELVRRWGEETRIAAIAERLRCKYCRRRQGASVDVVSVRDESGTEGDRARAKLGPVDRLPYDLARLKPQGTVR